jgi:dihydrofolate reductase
MGGASFYEQMLPSIDRLYITQIEGEFEGDAHFPEFDQDDFVETPISIGIIAGLVVGKVLGIFGVAWAAVKLKIAVLPQGSSMSQIFGVSFLGGIGGASFYEQMLPSIDRLYITQIEGEFEGDAHFPEFDQDDFVETFRESHTPDERNPHTYHFTILDRKQRF